MWVEGLDSLDDIATVRLLLVFEDPGERPNSISRISTRVEPPPTLISFS